MQVMLTQEKMKPDILNPTILTRSHAPSHPYRLNCYL
jgi:hypothetical protein